jgi:beta-lactamase regulating signal transducer with metallopeptidase domain
VCTLIVILPLAYPLKTLFPDSAKIPVHLELNYFKQHSEIASEKSMSENASFLLNKETTAGLSERSEAASGPGIKVRFMETMSALFSNWMLIAAIVWGGVFFFSLVRVAVTGFKTNKFLRLADSVTDPKILKLLQQCVSDTNLRRIPELNIVEGISTPMVIGFFTPGIIIPRHLLKPEFREGLRFTLLHELKHLQQYHNWWLLVESVIGAAYFFHPVFHWAKRKIHEELENICDRHVIRVTDNSVSYADFLLNQIWQQSSGRHHALALPFVSTVSKTTTRIHSILENARPAPFMHIRDRISVLFILMAFPSILLLSIAPSVQHSDQALNILNPLKINSQESTNHKSELTVHEKEISYIKETSVSPVERAQSHVEKTAPAIKPAGNTALPAKLTMEETTVPVRETESPSIEEAEEENKTEVIQKNSTHDITRNLDVIGSVSGNDMLPAQNDAGTGEATDKPISPGGTIADKYLGPPVNELAIIRIYNIKVLDAYTILFMMRGGDLYLARLSEPCPSLLYASDYKLLSINGRLSKFDRIQAVSHDQIIGTSGMLFGFYPYKYEGNKYEAIKLLKKSLLAKLVNEGAL